MKHACPVNLTNLDVHLNWKTAKNYFTIQFLLPYGFPIFPMCFPCFPTSNHGSSRPAPLVLRAFPFGCRDHPLVALPTVALGALGVLGGSVNRGRPVLESTKMLGLVKCLRFITQHVEHVGGIATQNHLGVMFKVRKWDRLGFNQQMVGVALRIGSFTSPTEGGLTTTSEGATNNPQQILHINSNL